MARYEEGKEGNEEAIIKERKKERKRKKQEGQKWKTRKETWKGVWRRAVKRREIIQVSDEGRNKDKRKRDRKKSSKEVERGANKLIYKERNEVEWKMLNR